jgi:LacI family transcriptional regulator
MIRSSPSIKQIAESLNCSQTTVSLILSGRAEEYGLSADTRKRVLTKAAELGYDPSQNRKRRKTLLVATPEKLTSVSRPGFVGDILEPLTGALTDNGWQIALARYSTTDPFGVTAQHLHRATVVVIPTNRDTARAANVLAAKAIEKNVIPLVLGRYYPDLDALFVDSDNAGGARAMAAHLFELGHRDVAVMTGTPGDRHAEERLEAFASFYAEAGHPLPEKFIWRDGDYSAVRAHRVMLEKIKKKVLPTAVFCFCDAMALGAIFALREAGIPIPKRISVAGFDDADKMDETPPPLTTIRIETGMVGKTVAERLQQMYRDQRRMKLEIRCPGRLIVRESTAPPYSK